MCDIGFSVHRFDHPSCRFVTLSTDQLIAGSN